MNRVSILLGYRAKLGAWLIVLFLIPVTLMLHKFMPRIITGPTNAPTHMIAGRAAKLILG